MSELDGIVEVVRGKFKAVNHYLSHGYRLLGVVATADGVSHGDGQFYVHKGAEYILGRAADVERAPLLSTPERIKQKTFQEEAYKDIDRITGVKGVGYWELRGAIQTGAINKLPSMLSQKELLGINGIGRVKADVIIRAFESLQ